MTWIKEPRRVLGAMAAVTAVVLVSAMAAGAASTAPKNLIVNGNAEQGDASPTGYDVVAEIPGWTQSGSFTVVPYTAGQGFPDATAAKAWKGGTKFFAGGPASQGSAISQEIDVTSMATLIDTGKAKATLSAFIGGYASQQDSLIASMSFMSDAGKKLGSARIGPVGAQARNSVTGMLKRTATKLVPKSTRSIRVVLAAHRTSGSYNDGYADNVSLTIGR